jgi:hypothetical protein
MRKQILLLAPILFIALVMLLLTATPPSSAQVAPTPTVDPFGVLTVEPVFQPTALPTVTPALTPQGTLQAPGCGSVFPIDIGDSVLVRSGVNLRALPTINGPLITNVTESRAGWYMIFDGPICADNFTWWLVYAVFTEGDQFDPVIVEMRGWMAERDISMSFFLDYAPSEGFCPPALDLQVGQEIELTGNVRIRNAPSLSGLVMTVAPFGAMATVINDQPLCESGYIWRQVRVQVLDLVYEGWMAEGTRLSYDELVGGHGSYIDPGGPLCYPPLDLGAGDLARVDYLGTQPKNLRDAPTLDSNVLHALVQGVPLEVIGGPVCADGLNWWQVTVMSTTPVSGWLAEGRRGDYWLVPFTEYVEIDPYRCCNLDTSGP